MKLKGRRIFITGAASGTGRATALLFAREGAEVALADIAPEGLEETCAMVEEEGARAAGIRVDVADEAAVTAAVAQAERALGGLNGVASIAGIDLVRSIAETSLAEWNRVFAVNVAAPFLISRAAIPHIATAGGGTIVTIASAAGLRPLEHRTTYCASKAAVVMFTKTLAIEVASSNIRANVICPGIIDTPQFRDSWENAPDPPAQLGRILERYTIRRVGRPEDIAQAALYLTSEDSAFVTGTALAVDGGRSFH